MRKNSAQTPASPVMHGMWSKHSHPVRTRHGLLLVGMLTLVVTQTHCTPDPLSLRTLSVDLPAPVVIEPVIVEHMHDHVTYNRQFRSDEHRFEPTHYTLKLADGREMNVFVNRDDPFVEIRDPATGRETTLGLWSRWSEPTTAWPPPPAPATRPAMPTSQAVTE